MLEQLGEQQPELRGRLLGTHPCASRDYRNNLYMTQSGPKSRPTRPDDHAPSENDSCSFRLATRSGESTLRGEDAVSKLGVQIGVDMAANVLKEFWPDLD